MFPNGFLMYCRNQFCWKSYKLNYPHWKFVLFLFSLFNVTSILIRQLLNKTIKSLNCHCHKPACCRKKRHRYLGLGLRPPDPDDVSDNERPQDGIISLKEFLEQNKMNIFLMQKHLVESANQKTISETSNAISAASVGPLAILTRQFGED